MQFKYLSLLLPLLLLLLMMIVQFKANQPGKSSDADYRIRIIAITRVTEMPPPKRWSINPRGTPRIYAGVRRNKSKRG